MATKPRKSKRSAELTAEPAMHSNELTAESYIVPAKAGTNLLKSLGKIGEKNPLWKGDLASENSKRSRAARKYQLGPCQRCGKPASDRHHKDGDTGNNEPENIAILCRGCHMIVDGRAKKLTELRLARSFAPHKPCNNCGKTPNPDRRKGLTKGRCDACYYYFYRNGIERLIAFEIPSGLSGTCKICGRPRSRLTDGRCCACYQYFWKHKAERPRGIRGRF